MVTNHTSEGLAELVTRNRFIDREIVFSEVDYGLGEEAVFMCCFSSEAKATEVEMIRRGYVSPIIFRIQAIILEVHAAVKAKLHCFLALGRESNALVFFFKFGGNCSRFRVGQNTLFNQEVEKRVV